MKILVIGLEGATRGPLFGDERLANIRRLMAGGCYGKLESVVPSTMVPAWLCMATSQDPGSLGVYGIQNRMDHSYDSFRLIHAQPMQDLTVWKQVEREGGRSILIGVPPSYPPPKINGISVGCFLTPDTQRCAYTHPEEERHIIGRLVGDYPADVKGFRKINKAQLRDEVHSMSRKHFEVARHYLRTTAWDYFQFVDIGLDRLHSGLRQGLNPQHVLQEPGNSYEELIDAYYLHLDEEIGKILELLSDDTILLVVSSHGSQPSNGGLCVNEWLMQQGLLVLQARPKDIPPFHRANINWHKTKAWSDGRHSAGIFFNVKGREPQGLIEQADYEKFRDEVKAMLEATTSDWGNVKGALAFKPQDVYKTVRSVAPDLIVHFGGLHQAFHSGAGHPGNHASTNGNGLDAGNPLQTGSFILAASNLPQYGEVDGAHMLDMAPTLLELGGYEIPVSMQGKSLMSGEVLALTAHVNTPDDEEELIRERLKGLGYIS
jgi:predicted AlkP superfamily phosphohydrolase/phosphomutase